MTFFQARQRVQFAVLLMSRRLENPDDNLQNAFFSYDGNSFTFTPIGDDYLASADAIRALMGDLVVIAQRQNTKYGFVLVSLYDDRDGLFKAILHGVSANENQVMESVLLRRKFGNPILERFIKLDESPWTDPLVIPLREWLMSQP